MTKLLTLCLRVLVILLVASFVAALVVSTLDASRTIAAPLCATKVEAISSTSRPDHRQDRSRCYLIDRESSRCDIVPLPINSQWGQLSVSPWCDVEGNTQGVCRSFRSAANGAEQSFSGLSRLKLPAGEVIDEVKLDLVLTGRVCWVPSHPGRILFAAGDGQLYRHDFPGWNSDPSQSVPDVPASSDESAPCRVTWEGSPPHGSPVYIADPVWPSHSLLRHLVFATIITPHRKSDRAYAGVTELLWLLMSDGGDVVKAAGLLDVPTKNTPGNHMVYRRFPNVELGRDGTIRIAYLERVREERRYRLQVVPLEIDPESGHPHVLARSQPRVLDEDSAPVSPLFSADGMSVFTVSRTSGLIVKRRIESDSPGKIHVASSH